jgi:hypothetical protein
MRSEGGSRAVHILSALLCVLTVVVTSAWVVVLVLHSLILSAFVGSLVVPLGGAGFVLTVTLAAVTWVEGRRR